MYVLVDVLPVMLDLEVQEHMSSWVLQFKTRYEMLMSGIEAVMDVQKK